MKEVALSLTDLLRGDFAKLLSSVGGATIIVIMLNADKSKADKAKDKKEPRYGIDPPVLF
jgi:hypothetical protein